MTILKTIPDAIFAESLDRLTKGESVEAIAASNPGYQEELVSLLSIAQTGISIPKLEAPTPYKAFRFKDEVVASKGFTEWFAYFRVAVIPIALVVVLLGGRTIVTATENSLPGDKLYSLKRATENAQLKLTNDQDKVASLHMEFMQKRIDEVKKAASSGNQDTETLAIAELKSQTEITFAEAGPVATANAISKQDPSLLENLVAINQQQKDVLAELSESSDSNEAKIIATSALEETKKTDLTLAKIIATVNDQALADMPNRVSVTGTITFYNGVNITVEKNVFTINERTAVTGIDGQNIASLTDDAKIISGRVTIIGTRVENGNLVAKQILLLTADTDTTEDGTVKGVTTPITKPVTKPIAKPTDPTTPIEPAPPAVDPTKAQGSFITEPASQQYAP